MSIVWEYRWYVLRLSYDAIVVMVHTQGRAGLSFCGCCALSIDEVNKFSHKTSENRHNLKLLKYIQMWGSK